MWVLACEEDDEASYRGTDDDHVADPSLASSICDVPDDDGHDGRLRKSEFMDRYGRRGYTTKAYGGTLCGINQHMRSRSSF